MKELTRQATINKLRSIFEDSSTSIVYDWFTTTSRVSPVVIVGSGFTRNARRSDGSRVTSKDAPLWADLTRVICEEMSIASPSAYDAPTLMELYHQHVGEYNFVHTMRDLLLDGDLIPGDAHEALANYPMEAIITTNLLDTVLDKTKGPWSRIVEDSHLALSNSRPKTFRQLIYFHGHRDNVHSWVLTRSQYEDVSRSRPLIVNRIRQLLVQHPLLILGYSLSDPDFHHIYRTVSRAMGRSQPKGIAIMKDPPIEAERRHWENLGIYCVTLREESRKDVGASIKRFLEISPNQRLSLDEIVRYVQGAQRDHSSAPLTAKLGRLTQILADESLAYIQDLNADDAERCWLACAESILPDHLRKQIEFTVRYGDLDVESPTSRSSKPQGATSIYVPQRAAISRLRLNRTNVALITDALLSESRARINEIIEWLHVWVRFASSPHRATTHRFDHAVQISYALLQSAQSAEFANQIAECEEVISRFGISVDGYTGTATSGSSSPWHGKMREALGFFRRNDSENSRASYHSAMQIARGECQPFREWLAAVGLLDCTDRGSNDFERAKEVTLRLERAHEVEEWNSSVKQALARVSQHFTPPYSTDEAWLVHSDKSAAELSNSTCSKLLRDLEHHCGPISLQRKLATPLIMRGAYRHDPVREFQRRLEFEVDDTDKWVQHYCGSRLQLSEGGSRADLDLKMWSVFADFQTDDLPAVRARLRVCPAIWPVVPEDAGPKLRGLIEASKKAKARSTNVFKLWTMLLIMSGPATLPDLFEHLRAPDVPWFGRVFSGLDDVPWAMWVRQGKMEPEMAANSILELAACTAPLDEKLGIRSTRIWPLVELATECGLDAESRSRIYNGAVSQFVDKILERSNFGIDEARSLGWLLSACDEERYRNLIGRVEATYVDLTKEKDWNTALELMIFLGECSVRGEELSESLTRCVRPWLDNERWDSFLQRANLQYPSHAISRSLAHWSMSRAAPELVQVRLRNLLEHSADYLPGSLSGAGSPDAGLLAHVHRYMAGTSKERGAALDAVSEGLSFRKSEEAKRQFLKSFDSLLDVLPGLSIVESPRTVRSVLRFSGAALQCRLPDETLDHRLTLTMDQITRDETPLVRQAGAYVTARLWLAALGTRHAELTQSWAKRFEVQPFASVRASFENGAERA